MLWNFNSISCGDLIVVLSLTIVTNFFLLILWNITVNYIFYFSNIKNSRKILEKIKIKLVQIPKFSEVFGNRKAFLNFEKIEILTEY